VNISSDFLSAQLNMLACCWFWTSTLFPPFVCRDHAFGKFDEVAYAQINTQIPIMKMHFLANLYHKPVAEYRLA
jgi:hypothetical protein